MGIFRKLEFQRGIGLAIRLGAKLINFNYMTRRLFSLKF